MDALLEITLRLLIHVGIALVVVLVFVLLLNEWGCKLFGHRWYKVKTAHIRKAGAWIKVERFEPGKICTRCHIYIPD